MGQIYVSCFIAFRCVLPSENSPTWKRGCTISFELQMSEILSTHFGKLLQVLPRKVEIAIFQMPVQFLLAVVFSEYSLL